MPNVTNQFTKDPLKFLKTYMTTCVAEGVGLDQMYLKLVLNEGTGIVQMVAGEADEARASFYVLRWSENQSSTGKLGSQADYFYTGPLTGCMFAVDKNWYTPRVIHVNELQHDQMNVQGMKNTITNHMQGATSYLRWSYTPNITVVESHNRAENERYGIFGWRGKLGWTFLRQTVDLDDITVLSVEKLDNWV